MATNYTDISGVIHIQKALLNDISNNSAADLRTIQSNLDAYYTAFTDAGTSTSQVLSKQDSVSNILNNEYSRLQQKESSVDLALE